MQIYGVWFLPKNEKTFPQIGKSVVKIGPFYDYLNLKSTNLVVIPNI